MPPPDFQRHDGREPEVLIQAVMGDRATSRWLKAALKASLECDPVDAVNDAEVLLDLLTARTTAIFDRDLFGPVVAVSSPSF